MKRRTAAVFVGLALLAIPASLAGWRRRLDAVAAASHAGKGRLVAKDTAKRRPEAAVARVTLQQRAARSATRSRASPGTCRSTGRSRPLHEGLPRSTTTPVPAITDDQARRRPIRGNFRGADRGSRLVHVRRSPARSPGTRPARASRSRSITRSLLRRPSLRASRPGAPGAAQCEPCSAPPPMGAFDIARAGNGYALSPTSKELSTPPMTDATAAEAPTKHEQLTTWVERDRGADQARLDPLVRRLGGGVRPALPRARRGRDLPHALRGQAPELLPRPGRIPATSPGSRTAPSSAAEDESGAGPTNNWRAPGGDARDPRRACSRAA